MNSSQAETDKRCGFTVVEIPNKMSPEVANETPDESLEKLRATLRQFTVEEEDGSK